MVVQLVGNCSKSYCGEFYNRGEVCCCFRSDKDKDVESYSSFMNLVWFQEGFGQCDTIADSCSITQSENQVSTNDSHIYKAKSAQNMNFVKA